MNTLTAVSAAGSGMSKPTVHYTERTFRELEALCPCSTDPDSLNFGLLPECPVDGDGVTFVAEVLRLRAVEQAARAFDKDAALGWEISPNASTVLALRAALNRVA